MKKFKFRLERVLQYRLLIKEDKRKALLLKNMKLHEAENRLAMLEQAELANRYVSGPDKVLSAQQIYLIGFFGQRLQDEIVKQRLAIIQLEKEVEEAMAEYTEAAREAKTLEIFRERKVQEYLDYVAKEEGKFLDELAVQKGNQLVGRQGETL